jgi:hypothetical protein
LDKKFVSAMMLALRNKRAAAERKSHIGGEGNEAQHRG